MRNNTLDKMVASTYGNQKIVRIEVMGLREPGEGKHIRVYNLLSYVSGGSTWWKGDNVTVTDRGDYYEVNGNRYQIGDRNGKHFKEIFPKQGIIITEEDNS